MLRIGSLFSGAGGLDMAVEQVFGGRTVWHSEIDPAASKVLAHRWPGVPNHSDITAVDWTTVEPVDILCGGWPCQPFSLAGKRKGADDERALWPYVARAVRMVRPRIVVLENVSAVLGPEFQRVANDMAALGYDIAWTCLRASDVGAPHRRERVFIVATDTASPERGGPQQQYLGTPRIGAAEHRERFGANSFSGSDAADTSRDGRHEGRPEPARLIGRSDAAERGDGSVDLLPTPRATRGGSNTETVELLPTPTAQSAKHAADDSGPGSLDDSNLWSVAARIGRGELLPTPMGRDHKGASASDMQRHSPNLSAITDLLPTPNASDGTGGGQHPGRREGHSQQLIDEVLAPELWGKYAPAIRRWENVTRPAPAPTEPNKNGNPRLSAAFSEWLMGWPAGWVTEVPGTSRNDQLRIIGNGVVPQQAQAAIRWLLNVSEAAA